ncbi:hypothetical protein [Rhodanobacter sp. C05]|uniref:hypothetical protein n=1 Tax=Rhodanobacter sp. C05 TaxID=1945855 RepID=UPI001179D0C0|nr:hypothetical protein [Rhodanobacter sp. C05]
MSKSRVELHRVLLELEKSMPSLIKKYPQDRDFMSAFVSRVDVITSHASPEDHTWVHGQIGCILDEYGKLNDGYPMRSNQQSS